MITAMNPISIDVTETRPFGHDLYRPECVVACRDGSVFVPDWRGGIRRVRSNGAQSPSGKSSIGPIVLLTPLVGQGPGPLRRSVPPCVLPHAGGPNGTFR